LREQQGRHQHLTAQVARWAEEVTRLLEDNRNLEQFLDEREATCERLQQDVSGLAGELHQVRGQTGALEERLNQVRQQLETVREQRSAVEMRLVELRSDARHLDETCRHDLGCGLAELPISEPLVGAQLEEAQQQHIEITRKIENLGPVNVLALEEFEEAQQRMEFLDTQRQDLLDSIRDTQQAIGEIDTVSQRKFNEAFEAINKNFREIFGTLFGGGLGEMRLVESENGEAGIEIVASPPGKRLQNVGLLSGGEKSLTAIALLMATFKYKPSPFCILDEVDAALDEPNIMRFRRLVQEMSEETQFVLITHSKATMEAAQTLYGVTMQEPGISKLVSVRIADHDPRPSGRANHGAHALTMEA
jgi:chromosome segregation protein